MLNKDLKADVVDDHAPHYDKKVPKKLHSSPQIGSLEDYIHAQIKAYREGDAKRQEHGCDVGLKRDEAEVENLFTKDEIVGYKVNTKS